MLSLSVTTHYSTHYMSFLSWPGVTCASFLWEVKYVRFQEDAITQSAAAFIPNHTVFRCAVSLRSELRDPSQSLLLPFRGLITRLRLLSLHWKWDSSTTGNDAVSHEPPFVINKQFNSTCLYFGYHLLPHWLEAQMLSSRCGLQVLSDSRRLHQMLLITACVILLEKKSHHAHTFHD